MAEQLELVAEARAPGIDLLRGLQSDGSALSELAAYLRETIGADPVTGLDSQKRFEGRLSQELKRAARFGHATAVAVFELRNLESLDLEVAAAAMAGAATRLQAELRDIDTVARLAGARFAALLPMCDTASATMVAGRALAALAALDGVTAVAGVASSSEGGAWELLESAELAAAGASAARATVAA